MRSATTRKRPCTNDIALLFPIGSPDPFDLVVIKAMANGDSGYRLTRGAISEVVDRGLTGFIADSLDDAVAAVPLARALDRQAIRRHFEERFSVERMAHDYVALYSELLRQSSLSSVSSSMSAAGLRSRHAANR